MKAQPCDNCREPLLPHEVRMYGDKALCAQCYDTAKECDGEADEPNYAPLRWWDPDDGWRIGSLCRGCFEEFGATQPKPTDYAYKAERDAACSGEPETDEDPSEAL